MNKIVFHEVSYRNLLASGNAFTVIGLDRSPTTMITGSNGTGKSTVIEAIFFALFGIAYRDVNKGTLLNTINNKQCEVQLVFSAHGKKFKIIRGIKPNIFEIYENDVMLDQQAASRDMQKYLEETILQFNSKTFRQIAILGTANYTPFMQLPALGRRQLIEDLLDITIFSSMNQVLKEQVSAAKQEVKDAEYNLDLIIDKIKIQENYISTLSSDKMKVIQNNQEEIDLALKEIDDLRLESDQIQKSIYELSDKISGKESLSSQAQKLSDLFRTIKNNKQDVESKNKFFTQNDTCPTCTQHIDLGFKNNIIEENDKKSKELFDAIQKLDLKIEQIQEKIQVIELIEIQIRESKQSLRIVQNTTDERNKYCAKLQKAMSDLNQNTGKIDEEKTKLKALAQQAVSLKEKKIALTEEKVYLDMCAVLLKDTGIKTKIIQQYLPVINKMINTYLDKLNFFAKFEMDETFKETIKSRNRDLFSYANFSEGEKKKLDLSILLTWITIARAKNTVSTNLLFLDEITDTALDGASAAMFVDILIDMAKDTNIFVITHHPDVFFDKFYSHIKFEKVGNHSVLI